MGSALQTLLEQLVGTTGAFMVPKNQSGGATVTLCYMSGLLRTPFYNGIKYLQSIHRRIFERLLAIA